MSRRLVAAGLVALLVWGLLVLLALAVTVTPTDVLTDEVMGRLDGQAASTPGPVPTPTCAVVVIIDEYGLEVPVRECR